MRQNLKPDVFIRADGGPEIGLGHLIRCMALAHMLKSDFTIAFYCESIPEEIHQEIIDNGFGYRKITGDSDFLSAIANGSIVVLDGYHFDAGYQKKIKQQGARLVCIDDLHNQEFYADLIINHAPEVLPEQYHAQTYTRFALGPEFVLLRPGFLQQAKKTRSVTKIKNVLVCFGGSDFRNLTERTLQIVKSYAEFEKIIIVTGSAYVYADQLSQRCRSDSRVMHFHAVDEEKMLTLMVMADLAIIPASGILLEALACNCTIISGKYVENQALLFERYKSAGTFISAGDFEGEAIKRAITLAFSTRTISSKVFDGESGSRLRNLFLAL